MDKAQKYFKSMHFYFSYNSLALEKSNVFVAYFC